MLVAVFRTGAGAETDRIAYSGTPPDTDMIISKTLYISARRDVKYTVMRTRETTYGGIIDGALYGKAESALLHCGVNPCKNGYTYLTEAAALYSKDCTVPIKRVYETVASFHGVKPRTVMRGITYAIEGTRELHKKLSQMLNMNIKIEDLRSGMVVAFFAKTLDPTIDPPLEAIKSHYTDLK